MFSGPAGETASNIDWVLGQGDNPDQLLHCGHCVDVDEGMVQASINQAVDRAIAIIPQTIHDDARYLLFSWNNVNGELGAVITDDSKTHDSLESVRLSLRPWSAQSAASQAERDEAVHYWIRDHLTTCEEFMRYSLIAIFCQGDRSQARLL